MLGELASFLQKINVNAAGESLRGYAFVGKGLGCYENFEVTPDAKPWSNEKITQVAMELFDENDVPGHGFSFNIGSVAVDLFWCWDGDGTLYFKASEDGEVIREIINTDCKKPWDWENYSMKHKIF